jgi:hypothetical protein
MTEATRPLTADVRRPTLAGWRQIDAHWWPADWLAETARRREILAHWTPGAALHRFDDGDLLCLAQPRAVDCDALLGWPLRRVAGTLCSAEVDASELAGLPVADAWIAAGAALRPLQFAQAKRGDPSEWLAVEHDLIEPFDLSTPAPERALVIAPPRALHEVLGPAVPDAPAAGTQRLVQALKVASQTRQRSEPSVASARARPDAGDPVSERGRAFLRGLVALVMLIPAMRACASSQDVDAGIVLMMLAGLGLAALLYRMLRESMRRPVGSAGARPAGGGTGAQGARPKQLGIRERLARSRVVPQRWRQWLARAAATTGLGRLLGAQHAAYMRRVLAMFDDGRLDEALRHAIPLGEDGADSLGQAFGSLAPRRDLALGDRSRASTSVNLGNDLREHLRALYRRTLTQLDAAGRVDEAVFVLAELLRNREEALDYLERHGRHAQAAELAFAWDMSGAQIVRLYALAGDWRRAVLVARRDGVFAEAVTLLEKRWPDPAARLRIEWAQSLAARGLALQAIRAIWPLAAERAQAAPWLDVAAAAGGAIAARALAWRAQCWPETLEARIDELQALQSDPARARDRAALADELLGLPAPTTPTVRRLAGFMAGVVLADHAAGTDVLAAGALDRLVQLAGDAVLSADLPALRGAAFGSPPQPLLSRIEALQLTAPPPGLQSIVDAVPLPDGEFLVAFGEAGVARIDAHGRRLAHFPVPALVLVPADDGHGAIALARRERVWRASRIDLTYGSAVDLGLHAFDAFAECYDDSGWTVAVGDRVQVLDVRAAGLNDALWQVAQLPGPVLAIDRADDHERWILRDAAVPGGLQQWVYRLPGRRLMTRDPVPPPQDDDQARARVLVRGAGLAEFRPDEADGRLVRVRLLAHDGPRGDYPAGLPLAEARFVLAAESMAVLARTASDEPEDAVGATLEFVDMNTGTIRARLPWPSDAQPVVRLRRDTWVAFDARGRLVALDARTSRVTALCLR